MNASAKGFESYFLEIMAMKKATRVSSPDIPPSDLPEMLVGEAPAAADSVLVSFCCLKKAGNESVWGV